MTSSCKPKLSAHDKFLKKFEYTNALDSVLQVSEVKSWLKFLVLFLISGCDYGFVPMTIME